jgi:hypothetical protein
VHCNLNTAYFFLPPQILTLVLLLGVFFSTVSAEETSTVDPTEQEPEYDVTLPSHEAPTDRSSAGPTETFSESNYPTTATDVNIIIEEVSKILAANSELPQLSRSEIQDILDNITTAMPEEEPVSENAFQIPTLQPGHYKTHDEYLRAMRALMLVLPYSAKNLSHSKIQELYTKAPIIQFIADNSEIVTTTTETRPSVTTVTEQPQQNKQYYKQQTKYPNHHEMYHNPYDSKPTNPKSSYNHDSQTNGSVTTLTTENISVTTRLKPNHHRRRRPNITTQVSGICGHQFANQHCQTTKFSTSELAPTTEHSQITGSYNTTDQYYQSGKLSPVQEVVTTVYPERPNTQEGNMSPNRVNPNYNVQLQPQFHNTAQHQGGLQPSISHKETKATSAAVSEQYSSTEPVGTGLDLPFDIRNILTSFSADDEQPVHYTTEQAKLFITPATDGSVLQSTKYSSQYSASEIATTKEPVMRDDVKEILASIGLFPDKETHSTAPGTSTTTAMPDIAAAAESLSSEMKDLLVSFGLLPSPNDLQLSTENQGSGQAYDQQAASPISDPSSYLNFKPLPLTVNENKEEKGDKYTMSSDMKQFLASFGLVPMSDTEEEYSNRESFHEHGLRSQKALKIEAQALTNSSSNIFKQEPGHAVKNFTEAVPHINMDMLTDEMKQILENLGFLPSTKLAANNNEGHIFNPSAHLASLHPTEEEVQRLSKLLHAIKELVKENRTITQNEIDRLNASLSFILPPVPVEDDSKTAQLAEVLPGVLSEERKEGNKSLPLDHIKNAPDPLSLEELLLVQDDSKNEIKRQQPNNGTSTEETHKEGGPSLTDLAASFGGGDAAADEVGVDNALPTKKPNGLYFLLDWNTFLDVGEEGSSRRVNLRFNPRLGNSRAFLPVTVP